MQWKVQVLNLFNPLVDLKTIFKTKGSAILVSKSVFRFHAQNVLLVVVTVKTLFRFCKDSERLLRAKRENKGTTFDHNHCSKQQLLRERCVIF